MKAWFRPLLIAGLGSLALAGCSLFEDDDEEQIIVAELVEFEKQFEAKELWSTSVGSGVGDHASRLRPAVAYDKVFAASRDGVVKALKKDNGKAVWETHLGEPDDERWFGGRHSAMVSGAITVAYQQLFIGTERGFVYSLNADTGEQRWKAVVGGEVLAPPAVSDGMVVVNTLSGKVYGLDAETGEEKWVFENAVQPLTLRGSGTPAISQGGVFMGTPDGKLNALFLDRGFQIWEEQVTQPSGTNDLERMVDVDADVIISGDAAYAVAYNGDLVSVELRTGREKWKRPYSSYQGMAIDGFDIYLSNSSSYVYSINRNDGSESWVNLNLENRQITTPSVVKGYVVVGDMEGYLHWLDDSTGEFVSRMEVDSDGLYSEAVVDEGVIYVQSRDGDVYAIETP
ncbi:outer membrane protein assembly factor BamB [Echinimonas agarilytica]|uniref:Outer membrane protein assembly factor BamB n=1 Tax=Echinimonas agarilytica TaxID=1215918 RepID=A0AA41W752_9GAMM|nr:outer membrane protein assembly factor BamB [Echinimonas agarilytica]